MFFVNPLGILSSLARGSAPAAVFILFFTVFGYLRIQFLFFPRLYRSYVERVLEQPIDRDGSGYHSWHCNSRWLQHWNLE